MISHSFFLVEPCDDDSLMNGVHRLSNSGKQFGSNNKGKGKGKGRA